MKLEDMKRIAAARTKGEWKADDGGVSLADHSDCCIAIHIQTNMSNAIDPNAEFIAMAANNIDLLFECAEFVKTVAPSWLPGGIRIRRLELLRALEKK